MLAPRGDCGFFFISFYLSLFGVCSLFDVVSSWLAMIKGWSLIISAGLTLSCPGGRHCDNAETGVGENYSVSV